MRNFYKTGELVHIPQAVKLLHLEDEEVKTQQLMIPLEIHETTKPEVAIVINNQDDGRCPVGQYIHIYCRGRHWSVRNDRVYSISKVSEL